MSDNASLIRADSIAIPLRDASVDLVVTSPPYFALRSYQDGGEHYDGQIGSEASAAAFLAALWAVTDECWRVLKPSGSLWVNLGDKYAGSGGHSNGGISDKSTLSGNGHKGGGPKIKATKRTGPDRYNQTADVRPKSKMLLPHRYALGCADPLGRYGIGIDLSADYLRLARWRVFHSGHWDKACERTTGRPSQTPQHDPDQLDLFGGVTA